MVTDETDVSYESDGSTVPAAVWLPSTTEGKSPAVLLCPGLLREVEGLAFLATAMADRGMIVLGTRYSGMDLRTDDRDCIAGLNYLSSLPEVDSDRIAIVGHSRGGMAGLRVAAKDARVASVVALQVVTDLMAYVKITQEYSPIRYQRLTESLGGSPNEYPDTYLELSPLTYVERIKIPVLLVAGTMDLHSPVDYSMRMREALLNAGNQNVGLEVLEGVGHFFERMYYGYVHDTIIGLTVEWLERTLGEKMPVSEKGAQKKEGTV